jgi:hypothetical protein
MNEPKRRGRPPKVDYHAAIYDEANSQMERSEAISAAQAYASRMWAKQSVSLSRHERLGRIAAALEAQGLSMEGVELP